MAYFFGVGTFQKFLTFGKLKQKNLHASKSGFHRFFSE